MSFLDISIIAVVLIFTLISAAWGFLRQLIAVGGLIAGLLLAGAFSSGLANSLGFIPDRTTATGVAFIIIVVVVSLIASIVATILYFVMGLLFLGLFDHLLGAGLGFIQGILVTGVLLVGGLIFFPDWMQQQMSNSFLAKPLLGPLSNLALIVAPPDLKNLVNRFVTNLT